MLLGTLGLVFIPVGELVKAQKRSSVTDLSFRSPSLSSLIIHNVFINSLSRLSFLQ